jgi:hypothetical protein
MLCGADGFPVLREKVKCELMIHVVAKPTITPLINPLPEPFHSQVLGRGPGVSASQTVRQA